MFILWFKKNYPQVTESLPHPSYDSSTVDNDVALLRLPLAVEYSPLVAPVCLPQQGEALPPEGELCTIIGWGKERHSHLFGTDVLHQAQVGTSTQPTYGKNL